MKVFVLCWPYNPMPKLNPTDHPIITQEFVAAILEKYNIHSFTYKSPASGIANTTLLIDAENKRVVLRIYRQGDRSSKNIEIEIAFMEMLGREGVPVPRVLSDMAGRQIGQINADGHEWLYIVMDFVPGEHADTYTPELIRNLARTQAKMHLLGATFLTGHGRPKRAPKRLVETFNVRISRSEIEDEAARAFLDRARDFTVTLPSSLPSGYNHLDYDADNVLVSHGEIAAVLDFDDLEYTPIVVCLGYTLWDILDETGDIGQVRAYLAEYQRSRDLSKEEINWLRPVLMFRNYVIGVIDVHFYGNNSERIGHCIELENSISKLGASDLVQRL